MKHKRIVRHLLFWGVFFGMSLFNVLYMSPSFSLHPSWDSFFRVTLSQVLIYAVKAFVVYYSIYSIIPRWIKSQKTTPSSLSREHFVLNRKSTVKYFLEFILVLLLGTLLIRVLTHTVIWTHIFNEPPRTFTMPSLIARYIYSLFDIIPIALGAVAIKLVQLRVKTLKQESQLIQEKLSTELLYLKGQTNPHFLFNTLNGIYALSRKQDPNTPRAITNLSNILRYMLYETSPETNPIRDELQLITDYIALQKLRFQDHLTVVYEADIDNDAQGISPLLLLPLVENAFKHSHELNTTIEIRAKLNDKHLEFSVMNNFSQEIITDTLPKEGIGLRNIKRQLAILYRSYTFEATKKENLFIVNLTIDLNSFIHA